VKKEDIKKSFDNIEPDGIAIERMLNNVLNHFEKKKEVSLLKTFKFNLKIAISVFAMVFVVAGSLLVYNLIPNNAKNYGKSNVEDYNKDYGIEYSSGNGSSISGNNSNGNAGNSADDNAGSVTEKSSQGASDSVALAPEGGAARIRNQFQIGNKHYIIMTDSQKAEFNFPDEIAESDIGRKLTTVNVSVDAGLIGSDVYEYIPAGCDAVVAIKINNEYKLFKFFNFESYNKNQDEDVSAYLELYGINSASDIDKIQLMSYSDQAGNKGKLDVINEIKDSERITKFYNFYSVIKNSSDKYFEKLFNYYNVLSTRKPAPQEIIIDSRSGAASSSGYAGSAANALSNSVIIRIYRQNGVYFEAPYYPNIGFISRHEISEEFAAFLRELMIRKK